MPKKSIEFVDDYLVKKQDRLKNFKRQDTVLRIKQSKVGWFSKKKI